ncbi:helix-turn-helix domain-containing protein [Lactobacillus crispatus]|uniref:helix-turn-helix domain-containing protein n=1 Tax=Lactobacillus crispatus TaxID=47770 RepID=UPI0021A786B9|nr:helix-turn-helix transcriptional regulator [Lactobacillus crispatus]MCT3539972.1 XRE family transcriptional regulator [Lactobacillus crispatus]
MNRIKELREKNNLTLRGLGKEINMSSSRISQYETGKREPKLETWNKLAEYFNVPTSYLMGTDNLKFPTKQEAIDFIHKIMKAQNIKLEDI